MNTNVSALTEMLARQVTELTAERTAFLADISRIVHEGVLPDGDGVNIPTLLWAEGWERKLTGKAP